MKYTFSFLLLLCMLLLTLTGCDSGASPADEEGVKAVSLILDGDVVYYLDEYTAKNGLSACPLKTGEWKTLCYDPLCTHEHECILYGRRYIRGVPAKGKMYYSAWNVFGEYWKKADSSCVLGCLDFKTMQYEDYVTYDRGSLLEEFVKCGDALYYYLIDEDGWYSIRRYDLNSKKETTLYSTDITISSLIVSEGHAAFGTGVGLYLGDLDPQSGKLENVRLAVPMSRDFIYDDICCYLHDGYVYYLSGKYVPEGESRTSSSTGDYCRFPIDGDISQSETVIQNASGPLFFHGSRIYYLPCDPISIGQYYGHNSETGPEDLPENLFEIVVNRGGISCYDAESGECAPFFKKDTLFIDQVQYADEEKMIVSAFCTDNVTIGEDRFIEGGYLSYNHNEGYFLINLKDGSYRMLMQKYPDQDAY